LIIDKNLKINKAKKEEMNKKEIKTKILEKKNNKQINNNSK